MSGQLAQCPLKCHSVVTVCQHMSEKVFRTLIIFEYCFLWCLCFGLTITKSIELTYIEMQRPGILYRSNISSVIEKPAEIFSTTLNELNLLHGSYTWWLFVIFSFWITQNIDLHSSPIGFKYLKILDYPK